MPTLQLVSSAKLHNDVLDLSAVTVIADNIAVDLRAREALRVARDDRTLLIDLPDACALSIRINGFAAGGNNYAISATSRLDTQPAVTWTTSGADAVSPIFTVEGQYVLDVQATPTGSSSAPRKQLALTAKIRKPGKPEDFLANQFPA